jgi:hypothetical protein
MAVDEFGDAVQPLGIGELRPPEEKGGLQLRRRQAARGEGVHMG